MNRDIKQEVLQKIRSGQVEMRSSLFFALRIAAFAFLAFSSFVLSVLIFNTISFHLRMIGDMHAIGFGMRGFLLFLDLFPWGLLILDIVVIALAASLMRQFKIGYQNPVILLVAVIIGLTLGVGVTLDRTTQFNEHFFTPARPAGQMDITTFSVAQHLRPVPDELRVRGEACNCIIYRIDEHGVVAYNSVATTAAFKIVLPPEYATSSLREGQAVFIAGDREGDVIRVFGIKPRHVATPPAMR